MPVAAQPITALIQALAKARIHRRSGLLTVRDKGWAGDVVGRARGDARAGDGAITHRSGAMERDPDPTAIEALVKELDRNDAEHPDIAVSHESGWTISAYPSVGCCTRTSRMRAISHGS